jgi:hypothetical protein
MGIVDYGIGPSGPYEYSTNESLGQVYINSLQTQNATGDPKMSFQLNVDLAFASNGYTRVYWIQDVIQVDTSTDYVWFDDNVWNSSSPTATMTASGISGNGQVSTISTGQGYYSYRGNYYGIKIALPATLSLLVTTQVNSFNQPTVTFEYSTGSSFQAYDTVTFVTVTQLTSVTGFEVNGFDYNPYGTFYDSELIMGGACCGYNVTDIQSDVRLSLYYWNGHNYQTVSNAYNFGSDTEEGASNVESLGFFSFAAGTLYSEIRPGSGTLGKLYFQSQIGIIDIRTTIGSGTLYVSNATNPSAIPAQYDFVGGEVTVTLAPGEYLLQIYQNGVLVDGATETVVAGQTLALQTPLGDIPVTMSDSFVGGSGFSPVLTYVQGGVQVTAILTSTPTAYLLDPGTSWSVTGNKTGATERWITIQPTSGIASSAQTMQFTYYHQYLVTFSYEITGGGTPESGPVAQYVQFGSSKTSPVGVPAWADTGSVYALTNPLPGSTSSERWGDNSASGTIEAPGTVSVTYYHQFTVVVSYQILGGGSPAPPSETGTEFGSPYSTQVGSQKLAVWFDSGTHWNLTNPLVGSTMGERWQSSGTTAETLGTNLSFSVTYYHQYAIQLSSSIVDGGAPTSPTFTGTRYGQPFLVVLTAPVTDFFDAGSNWTLPIALSGGTSSERWITMGSTSGVVGKESMIQANYTHQFFVSTGFSPGPGGSIVNSTGWHDSGSMVQLSASTNAGWKFGGWTGNGSGSYSGTLNQSSIQANGPIDEGATFLPGLKIIAGGNGGVSYSYGLTTGAVQAGTSVILYAPVGTVVSLTALPTSFLYQFSGWMPSSTASSGSATVTLQSPSSVQASFSLNIIPIGAIVGVVIAVVLGAVLAFRRRARPHSTHP